MESEWPTRKLSETLTSCILEASTREIRKNNPHKSVFNVAPEAATRLSNDRDRLFSRYKETGSAENAGTYPEQIPRGGQSSRASAETRLGNFLPKYGLPGWPETRGAGRKLDLRETIRRTEVRGAQKQRNRG